MRYVAQVAQYAALITACISIVFGWITVRQWQLGRALSSALEVMQIIQPPEFARSIRIVIELPENAAPQDVESNREAVEAVYIVSHVFESIGMMVFYRLMPLHLVDHLIGGYVRASWRRLRPYVEERRKSLGVMFGEWFQWLAERMEQEPAPGKAVGAAAAHRNWRA